MNLFSKLKDSAMAEPTVPAVDVLRTTVRARNRSPHALGLLAREIDGVGTAALEDFAKGKADLSVKILKSLTKVLYPGAEYDPDRNLLQTLALPAKPLGCAPAAYDPAKHSAHHPPPAGPQARGTSGITPVKPVPPTKRVRRPGWVRLDWE